MRDDDKTPPGSRADRVAGRPGVLSGQGAREAAIRDAGAPSSLDAATLARMRAEAVARAASPFIDPKLARDARALLTGADRAWLTHVTGRPATWYGDLSNAELYLAVQAVKADAPHLEAVAAARRAEQQRASRAAADAAARAGQAERDAWQALARRLPVPVAVWHNWTPRHLDGYEQGADHIVVLRELHAGRLHRAAYSPLCWTPSRARELRDVSGNAGDERRVPDCKACLRHAGRLAAGQG